MQVGRHQLFPIRQLLPTSTNFSLTAPTSPQQHQLFPISQLLPTSSPHQHQHFHTTTNFSSPVGRHPFVPVSQLLPISQLLPTSTNFSTATSTCPHQPTSSYQYQLLHTSRNFSTPALTSPHQHLVREILVLMRRS